MPTQLPSAARIKTLSLQLANQIAAGEVVERPASVVKELLENAIDAGASQISIDIEHGGSSLIRIGDNGQGIVKQDLCLAVTRHATSKLHTLIELEKMDSLGFRGEALASISAVSRLAISSRSSEADQAWMIDTGTDSDFANYYAEPEPVSHPQGTTIEVRDLFFNTPARRKFLRTVKTEFRHIDEIVKRLALSRFNVAFKLSHNHKQLRNLPKAVTDKAIIQRISKLLSPDFIQHAYRVDFSTKNFGSTGPLRLWGWVASPQLERKQADWQLFYVNGRFIRDKLVNHALRQVYQHLLTNETYPAYLLYLEIEPTQVDVNVHPTKHEVRFRQTRLVHDFIFSALNEALSRETVASPETRTAEVKPLDRPFSPTNVGVVTENNELMARQDKFDAVEKGVAEKGAYYNRYASGMGSATLSKRADKLNSQEVNAQLQGLKELYQPKPHPSVPQQDRSTLFGQYLSCIDRRYILTQQDNNLYIIDINKALPMIFEALFEPGKSKTLLIPQSVSMDPLKLEQLLINQSLLSQWGMEISQLGPDMSLFRSLPATAFLTHCEIIPELFLKSWQDVMPAAPLAENQQDEFHKLFINSIKSALTLSSLDTEHLMQFVRQLERAVDQLQQHPESIQSRDHNPWTVIDAQKIKALFNTYP